MIKTDRYVQTEAVGMLYRLIPVTEEIIRCVIGKEEIKGNDSLIIEKKEYPAVEFAAEENEEKLELKTGKVLVSLELSSGRIEWKHADGTRWCI
jgi:alpha-D-xyloside xylohydrolase